ncbi:MAG: hypothetical protein P8L71_07565 [Flavobacteriales bacterium]|nr:hypothetical protein [Flavobacteriales bacterium]
MLKRLLVCIFLFATLVGWSQTITIRDAQTLEPLEAVTILDISSQNFVVTDPMGQANIDLLKGAEKVTFIAIGYQRLDLDKKELALSEYNIVLTQSTFPLDEVVISTTRWEKKVTDVPNKISVIKPNDIKVRQPQTSADLLGSTGYIFIQKVKWEAAAQ